MRAFASRRSAQGLTEIATAFSAESDRHSGGVSAQRCRLAGISSCRTLPQTVKPTCFTSFHREGIAYGRCNELSGIGCAYQSFKIELSENILMSSSRAKTFAIGKGTRRIRGQLHTRLRRLHLAGTLSVPLRRKARRWPSLARARSMHNPSKGTR